MLSRKEILKKLDGKSVDLLAVSKKQSIVKILALYDEGQRLFGENYVQELLEKKLEIGKSNISWHMIGPLQTNKVNKIVGEVDLIHSVDSVKLAKVISERADKLDIKQNILVQINTSGETTKSGLPLENCHHSVKEILELPGLNVRGFMTMPPFAENPESSRPHFRSLRMLRDQYASVGASELSMGTTQDFEVAIDEGATIIRVGEALFGSRE